jgi:hypothetical protein
MIPGSVVTTEMSVEDLIAAHFCRIGCTRRCGAHALICIVSPRLRFDLSDLCVLLHLTFSPSTIILLLMFQRWGEETPIDPSKGGVTTMMPPTFPDATPQCSPLIGRLMKEIAYSCLLAVLLVLIVEDSQAQWTRVSRPGGDFRCRTFAGDTLTAIAQTGGAR